MGEFVIWRIFYRVLPTSIVHSVFFPIMTVEIIVNHNVNKRTLNMSLDFHLKLIYSLVLSLEVDCIMVPKARTSTLRD